MITNLLTPTEKWGLICQPGFLSVCVLPKSHSQYYSSDLLTEMMVVAGAAQGSLTFNVRI